MYSFLYFKKIIRIKLSASAFGAFEKEGPSVLLFALSHLFVCRLENRQAVY